LIYAGRITVTGLGTMVCLSLAGTQGMMAKSTQTSRGENKKIPFYKNDYLAFMCKCSGKVNNSRNL